jgi:hypothetical protein
MKKISGWLTMLAVIATTFVACKKDEKQIFFEGGTPPVLTASTSAALLSVDIADEQAIAFSWTNPNYQFTTGISSQDVTYTLEVDTVGASFSNPGKKQVEIKKELKRAFTVSEINTIMLVDLELAVGVSHSLEARVVATIGAASATKMVSNVVSFTATPYEKPITISYLYVPGNYQGWSPSTAPRLGSLDSKEYEGYLNMADASGTNMFKITTAPNWDNTNYGDGGPNLLSATGGDIALAKTGYFRFKVNTKTLAWGYEPMNWGIIGDATPDGWDKSTPLTYNADTKMLTISSIALKAGSYKFRANDGWDINFGGANNDLQYGGGNLALAEGGNYKVELDLTSPLGYKAILTKL